MVLDGEQSRFEKKKRGRDGRLAIEAEKAEGDKEPAEMV